MPRAARKLDIPPMTVEEFLAWDGGGHVGKLELVDGVVRAMAPASAVHGMIQGNLVTAIKNHLRARKSPCRAATEAPVLPPMAKRRNARAPDVSVTCAPITDSKTFDDPVLIVEVMSPDNEDDTWESIRALATLPTMREVLVVQSTRVEAEVYLRDARGAWPDDPVSADPGGSIRLEPIDLTIPVSEIYEGTHLL